jgi:hypothetical protein
MESIFILLTPVIQRWHGGQELQAEEQAAQRLARKILKYS